MNSVVRRAQSILTRYWHELLEYLRRNDPKEQREDVPNHGKVVEFGRELHLVPQPFCLWLGPVEQAPVNDDVPPELEYVANSFEEKEGVGNLGARPNHRGNEAELSYE